MSKWDLAIAQCCQAPVNIPGHIQPFGSLLATDENLEYITHVSANLPLMLGMTATQEDVTSLLGQDLQAVLSEELIHNLRSACGLPWIQTQRERIGIHDIQGKNFDVSVHFNGHRTLIELEPLPEVWERHTTLVSRMKSLLQSLGNLETILHVVTQELRNATGFDHVMAYQFLQDGAGEVVAEARSTDGSSFLGLRFPATDIPNLSRSLLLKTPVRVIPDIDAPPAPLLAWDRDEDPLDLSLVQLRGASTVHTQQYLRGMGVQGSMTLAITFEEQLWGLFTFHHGQSKLLSPEFRAVLEFCGMLLSLHLQQTIAAEQFYARKQAATILAQTFAQTEQPTSETNKREKALNQSWEMVVTKAQAQLCQLLGADGLVFVFNQKILASYGQVPPKPSILALINHPSSKEQIQSETGIMTVESFKDWEHLTTESTPEGLPRAINWGDSAGGGLFSIQYYGDHYFVFFRNELSSQVKWAGNPHQQKVVPTDGEFKFSPQRSFDVYQETVQGRCRAWSDDDLAVILEVKAELQNQVGLFVQQQQELLIAELKHRVKNILAMIRSVARQTSRSKTSIAEYIDMLEQRIAALALAHELLSHTGTEWPNLQNILKTELRPYLADQSERGPRVLFMGPEVKLSSQFIPTFILVIHELVSNAVKYGALSVPGGQVTVTWYAVNGGAKIHWKEANGPKVEPPQERGFGCDLIERAIAYEFDGETTLRFLPSGVEADFWLPQDLVDWVPVPSPPQKQELVQQQMKTVDAQSSRGASLVVEDNMLIAIELENTLKDLGFDPVDCAPNVDRAMKLLNQKQYSVCWLDIDLKKETSFAVAYELKQRQIPFVFTTGYDSKHPVPDDLRSVILLKKPFNLKKLQDNLEQVMGNSK